MRLAAGNAEGLVYGVQAGVQLLLLGASSGTRALASQLLRKANPHNGCNVRAAWTHMRGSC